MVPISAPPFLICFFSHFQSSRSFLLSFLLFLLPHLLWLGRQAGGSLRASVLTLDPLFSLLLFSPVFLSLFLIASRSIFGYRLHKSAYREALEARKKEKKKKPAGKAAIQMEDWRRTQQNPQKDNLSSLRNVGSLSDAFVCFSLSLSSLLVFLLWTIEKTTTKKTFFLFADHVWEGERW